ncbi:Zn-ribbon domain-containing OB-fold protein [Saccharopolyspora spinosa]|uniref:Zn-ribbon domain-containing OB-fold protein n=1 Tax=Saccharopolyspora spinosa TaxID=60894 RepID=UPI000302C3D1|nr:OB-fold domain-containing protein [Saccharopolyspora spinosa]
MINRDTAYFWEGAAAGELRIQRCGRCGLLRHPPGPMCPECGAATRTHLVSEGLGEVYSSIVHHHPLMPGKDLPLVVALVELDEGVRVLGELLGVAPEDVRIGHRVAVDFQRIDDELVLPGWRLHE